eukprot:scaffold9286_cov79-Skeletonema_dohrnii-CCMP3373.AAC.1
MASFRFGVSAWQWIVYVPVLRFSGKWQQPGNSYCTYHGSDKNSMQPAESMLSDELLRLCQSDSLSEDGLREIIERRQNNEEGIIQCLIKYFPAAASATDEIGRSPLHLACGYNKNVTPGVVQLLIDATPDFVHSEDGTQNHHDKKRLLLGGRNHKQQYSYQTNGTALSVMVLRAMSMKESH